VYANFGGALRLIDLEAAAPQRVRGVFTGAFYAVTFIGCVFQAIGGPQPRLHFGSVACGAGARSAWQVGVGACDVDRRRQAWSLRTYRAARHRVAAIPPAHIDATLKTP
jgi:hypothetical protein